MVAAHVLRTRHLFIHSSDMTHLNIQMQKQFIIVTRLIEVRLNGCPGIVANSLS